MTRAAPPAIATIFTGKGRDSAGGGRPMSDGVSGGGRDGAGPRRAATGDADVAALLERNQQSRYASQRRIVAILAQPVMPTATAAILHTLGQPEGPARQFTAVGTPIVAGTELPAPAPVFPKYEEPAEA